MSFNVGFTTYWANCNFVWFFLVVDLCLSSPCMYGTCYMNTSGSYYCSCYPGYNGTRCETGLLKCIIKLIAQRKYYTKRLLWNIVNHCSI